MTSATTPPLGGRNVCVLVQGDLGRSPRILRHAARLAHHGATVSLVGLEGAPVPLDVASHPSVRLYRIHESRTRDGVAPLWFLPAAGLDAAALAMHVGRVMNEAHPELVLAQIPPSVSAPTIAAGWARATSTPLVLDWHNLGASRLKHDRGSLVGSRLLQEHERVLAHQAARHLCVSDALGEILAGQFGVEGAVTLVDRPTQAFLDARRAPQPVATLGPGIELPTDVPADTPYVLSSTSFGPDEDLAMLLDAARRLDAAARAASRHVAVVVSGRGPGRDDFERRARELGTTHVHVRAHWVTAEEYPALVAGAALGISLHQSTSGVDLPIKIAELFGAGVPVLAYDYGKVIADALEPLDTPTAGGAHAPGRLAMGKLFRRAEQLAERLGELVLGDGHALQALRDETRAAPCRRWEEEWDTVALPLLSELLTH